MCLWSKGIAPAAHVSYEREPYRADTNLGSFVENVGGITGTPEVRRERRSEIIDAEAIRDFCDTDSSELRNGRHRRAYGRGQAAEYGLERRCPLRRRERHGQVLQRDLLEHRDGEAKEGCSRHQIIQHLTQGKEVGAANGADFTMIRQVHSQHREADGEQGCRHPLTACRSCKVCRQQLLRAAGSIDA